MAAASDVSTKPRKGDDIARISLSASLDAYDVWRARFSAYIIREKSELYAFLDPTNVKAPTAEQNVVFGSHLLPFIGDDVIKSFRRQIKNPVLQGVDLYRLLCEHFVSTAPAEELSEDIFLRMFPTLVRDRYPSVASFLQEVQLLHQQLTTVGAHPFLERVLVFHALVQLAGGGKYAPWAGTILAQYRIAVRAAKPGPSDAVAGVTMKKLMDDVSSYVTPSAGGTRDVQRYAERPFCSNCNSYGHPTTKCWGKKRSGGGSVGGSGPSVSHAHVASVTKMPDGGYADSRAVREAYEDCFCLRCLAPFGHCLCE